MVGYKVLHSVGHLVRAQTAQHQQLLEVIQSFLPSAGQLLPEDSTTQCNTIQYNTIQCKTMQDNAMQCNAMQCNAMQCNAMQCNAMQCNAMQCNAMQCNAMQCNAMQCNTMQYNVIQYNIDLFSAFIVLPIISIFWAEGANLSLCCMATFVTIFVALYRWPFLSTFHLPLPFLCLSSDNPPILAVVYTTFCNLLVSFILTMCPANLIQLLTILRTTQTLVPTFSLRSVIVLLSLSLQQLFSSSSCYGI